MKRCTDCMRHKTFKFEGCRYTHNFCNQGKYGFYSCSGGECEHPDLFISIEEQLRKYVGGKYSSRELNISTYFYKLGVKQNKI